MTEDAFSFYKGMIVKALGASIDLSHRTTGDELEEEIAVSLVSRIGRCKIFGIVIPKDLRVTITVKMALAALACMRKTLGWATSQLPTSMAAIKHCLENESATPSDHWYSQAEDFLLGLFVAREELWGIQVALQPIIEKVKATNPKHALVIAWEGYLTDLAQHDAVLQKDIAVLAWGPQPLYNASDVAAKFRNPLPWWIDGRLAQMHAKLKATGTTS